VIPYNLSMARGWESKSVEQQQDEAASKKEHREVLTPEQIAERQRRQGLELSRQRILQQLQAACNPRHRQMLEAALAELEAQLGGR
jgi:delta 1-pyrroline-5-carboxylate dehydrogenase